MKTFRQFISEDIDLFSGLDTHSNLPDAWEFKKRHERLKKGLGYSNDIVSWVKRKLTPDLTLFHYKYTRATSDIFGKHILVVANEEKNEVAVEVEALSMHFTSKPHPFKKGSTLIDLRMTRKGKTMEIKMTSANPKYTKSKTGISIPQMLYKEISKAGYTIVSDSSQTLGGASIWQALRQDVETADRMDLYDPNENSIRSAKGLPDEEIWSTLSGDVVKKMKKVKAKIPVNGSSEGTGERHLVLRGLRTRKKL